MSGFTALIYNGIVVRNCQTTKFEQLAIYAEGSNDLIGFRYLIGVVGYVHSHVAVRPAVVAQGSAANAGQAWQSIHSVMMQPRQSFSFWVGANDTGNGSNGTALLVVQPASTVGGAVPLALSETNQSVLGPYSQSQETVLYDTKSGPRPISLHVQQITGNEVFRVEYLIELNVAECGVTSGVSANNTGVLSNKWSCHDEIDDNFYTTRTIQGRLTLFNANFNPHAFRKFVVPRLQKGMRRQRMVFIASTDGLALDYTIIDREIAFAAPYPATKWHMLYTERTGMSDTSLFANGELQLSLEAPRDVKRVELITLGSALVEARLRPAAEKDSVLIEELSIMDEYGDDVPNRIRMSCRVKRLPKNEVALANSISKTMGVPITAADLGAIARGYDSNISFGARPGDPVFLSGPIPLTTAWGCYMQSICSPTHDVQTSELNIASTTEPAVQPQPTINATIQTTLPTTTLSPSQDYSVEDQSLYTYWRYESKIQTNHHRVVLPIANSTSISSGSSGSNKDTCVVAPIAQPTTMRIVRISGQRVGKPPKLPKPVSEYTLKKGGRAILLRDVVLPSTPGLTADRKQLFDVNAEYHYALTRPVLEDDDIDIGFNPWCKDDASKTLTDLRSDTKPP